MNDELTKRLDAAGIVTTPEQLEAIRYAVAMAAACRLDTDPVGSAIALIKRI